MDTPRETIVSRVTECLRQTKGSVGVKSISTKGPYASLAFVVYETPKHMWVWLSGDGKGKKFTVEEGVAGTKLWFTIETTQEERGLKRRARNFADAFRRKLRDHYNLDETADIDAFLLPLGKLRCEDRDEDDIVDAENDLERQKRNQCAPSCGVRQPFHAERA